MASTPLKPPRDDPWYKATAGYETAKPGTILRMRVARGNVLDLFPSCSAAYNILFATTDSLAKPAWAVTTLFVPKIASDGRALLSYQFPYNCSGVDGSPSNILYSTNAIFWPNIRDNVELGLGKGWHVNFPDFEGPDAAFGDGVIAGYTTLDSIRAVLSAGFAIDRSATSICLWGFSGGAFASAWAAQMQPLYAPELNCVGAVLGALPSDFAIAPALSGTQFAGLAPHLLLGVTANAPVARDWLVAELETSRKEEFLAAQHLDIGTSFARYANQDVWAYFRRGEAVIHDPIIRDLIARKTTLGNHGIPEMPLFVHKSVLDEGLPIEGTDALLDKWGRLGVNVLYERNLVGSHLEEAVNGHARAVLWMEMVLTGKYRHNGYIRRDVTIREPQR